MKSKNLFIFLLVMLIIFGGTFQETFAQGGKGKQIEDPFERAWYWGRKVVRYSRKDPPKAERFRKKFYSLTKHTLLPLGYDEIDKLAGREACEGRWNECRAKVKFLEFYQKFENDNESIRTEYSQAYIID